MEAKARRVTPSQLQRAEMLTPKAQVKEYGRVVTMAGGIKDIPQNVLADYNRTGIIPTQEEKVEVSFKEGAYTLASPEVAKKMQEALESVKEEKKEKTLLGQGYTLWERANEEWIGNIPIGYETKKEVINGQTFFGGADISKPVTLSDAFFNISAFAGRQREKLQKEQEKLEALPKGDLWRLSIPVTMTAKKILGWTEGATEVLGRRPLLAPVYYYGGRALKVVSSAFPTATGIVGAFVTGRYVEDVRQQYKILETTKAKEKFVGQELLAMGLIGLGYKQQKPLSFYKKPIESNVVRPEKITSSKKYVELSINKQSPITIYAKKGLQPIYSAVERVKPRIQTKVLQTKLNLEYAGWQLTKPRIRIVVAGERFGTPIKITGLKNIQLLPKIKVTGLKNIQLLPKSPITIKGLNKVQLLPKIKVTGLKNIQLLPKSPITIKGLNKVQLLPRADWMYIGYKQKPLEFRPFKFVKPLKSYASIYGRKALQPLYRFAEPKVSAAKWSILKTKLEARRLGELPSYYTRTYGKKALQPLYRFVEPKVSAAKYGVLKTGLGIRRYAEMTPINVRIITKKTPLMSFAKSKETLGKIRARYEQGSTIGERTAARNLYRKLTGVDLGKPVTVIERPAPIETKATQLLRVKEAKAATIEKSRYLQVYEAQKGLRPVISLRGKQRAIYYRGVKQFKTPSVGVFAKGYDLIPYTRKYVSPQKVLKPYEMRAMRLEEVRRGLRPISSIPAKERRTIRWELQQGLIIPKKPIEIIIPEPKIKKPLAKRMTTIKDILKLRQQETAVAAPTTTTKGGQVLILKPPKLKTELLPTIKQKYKVGIASKSKYLTLKTKKKEFKSLQQKRKRTLIFPLIKLEQKQRVIPKLQQISISKQDLAIKSAQVQAQASLLGFGMAQAQASAQILEQT